MSSGWRKVGPVASLNRWRVEASNVKVQATERWWACLAGRTMARNKRMGHRIYMAVGEAEREGRQGVVVREEASGQLASW